MTNSKTTWEHLDVLLRWADAVVRTGVTTMNCIERAAYLVLRTEADARAKERPHMKPSRKQIADAVQGALLKTGVDAAAPLARPVLTAAAALEDAVIEYHDARERAAAEVPKSPLQKAAEEGAGDHFMGKKNDGGKP